jgi:uncharacterized membrane protein YfcA
MIPLGGRLRKFGLRIPSMPCTPPALSTPTAGQIAGASPAFASIIKSLASSQRSRQFDETYFSLCAAMLVAGTIIGLPAGMFGPIHLTDVAIIIVALFAVATTLREVS